MSAVSAVGAGTACFAIEGVMVQCNGRDVLAITDWAGSSLQVLKQYSLQQARSITFIVDISNVENALRTDVDHQTSEL